ncbi:MAG: hypothetical protein FD181_3123 [Prolixibacteraceae bacterium]|nr:MAG: hypothetical protein FD181_3123 [Prolixibacteraceae bacterium]
MKFHQLKLKYFIGDTKLRKTEIFDSGIFIHLPFIFNQKWIGRIAKNKFHLFESQHFRYKCWLFF